MVTTAVHRIIEQHAAAHADTPALVEDRRVIGYRELNHRANVVARHLINHGFRRGGHAVVRMDIGVDLATVLLAILKAGGCYTWLEPRLSRGSSPVTIAPAPHDGAEAYVPIDVKRILAEPVQAGPNLPILARPSDVACVLQDDAGQPAVLVPHSTITALRDRVAAPICDWTGDPSSLDLWIGLMAGATLTVETASAMTAEAA